MTKPAKISKVFDQTKLDAMEEPLTVRVERLKGGARTPIPLPASEEGGVQGTNWTKTDIAGLESWLVTQWAGGGWYEISITDSTQPIALKHDWQIFYSLQQHPERIPPTLQTSVPQPPLPPQPPQPQASPMTTNYPSSFPNGLPTVLQQPQPQQPVGQPQTIWTQPPQQPTWGQQPLYQRPDPAATAAVQTQAAMMTRMEEQLRDAQAQLAKARDEQIAAQHRQELDRLETARIREAAATKDQLAKFEQMIASIAAGVTAKPAADPALEMLKEQNARLQAQMEADKREREAEKREREAERRDRETRDMIQRSQEDSRRAIEAMQAQMQAAVAAATANKGPDQMIMLMQENARQQIEAAKEQSRMQREQIISMQAGMLKPSEIIAMAKESSAGVESATRSMAMQYQSILDMQRKAVEQVMQLNPQGGSEIIPLVEKGLEKVSALAERYVGGKTREAVTQQQTQAQLAQANAQAMTAQASAMATQAAMQRQQSAGLNGATVGPKPPIPAHPHHSTPTLNEAKPEVAPSKTPGTDDGWSTGPVAPIATAPKIKKVLGHTDEEWFGPILPQVGQLRAGAAKFVESVKAAQAAGVVEGKLEGIDSVQAAMAIAQATVAVVTQKIPILAMMELLMQERLAEFADVLLPDVPQAYRDDMVQALIKINKGEDPNEVDDDDDGEGEGDDDDDEGDDTEGGEHDGDDSKEPLVVVKPAATANGRARA